MSAIFDLLTWQSGFFVIAALSAAAAYAIIQLPNGVVRWSAAALAPIVLSYCLYWLPVWLGYESTAFGEIANWAPVFVVPWSFIGLLVSMGIVFIATRRRRKVAQEQVRV